MIKRTFSFINLKGGVGKTTICATLAYILGHDYGLKVLVINNDKQGNINLAFGVSTEGEYTLADILRKGADLPEHEVVQATQFDNIDIIGADMDLAAANLELMQDQNSQQHNRLEKFLTNMKKDYDFCIIDNAPDINISTINALKVTNEVVVVANPDIYAIEGTKYMQQQIDLARQYNKTLNFRGVIINKFVKTPNSFLIKKKIEKNYPVFETNVRHTKDRINEAITEGRSIIELSPWCGFSRDMRKFTKELLYIK